MNTATTSPGWSSMRRSSGARTESRRVSGELPAKTCERATSTNDAPDGRITIASRARSAHGRAPGSGSCG